MDIIEKFDLIDPSYGTRGATTSLARRITDFNGLRMGLIDNRKHNVDHLLTGFEQAFRNRYEIADVTRITKFLFSYPASETDIAQIAEHCDFVIEAIAD